VGALVSLRSGKGRITPIGIDVGDVAVRAAQLQRSGESYIVTHLGSWAIPTEAIPNDEDSMTADRIATWLGQMGFRKRSCVMGLSSPDVELHAMELPHAVNEAQTRQAARWEVERLMSFEEGTATTDYWPIPEGSQMTSSAIGVAASPTSFDALRPICDGARLRCVRLDATACALARFGSFYRGPVSDTDVWGILDLGSRQSRLTICVSGVPILVRSFNNGGGKWTDLVSSALSISTDAAERHKCDHGICANNQRRSGDRPKEGEQVGEMIFNALRDELGGMVAELERSYKYAIRCFGNRPCGPLLLVGGGAGTKNLPGMLREKLGIEVIVPSVEGAGENCKLDFSQVKRRMKVPLAEYASAIGLSIEQGDAR